MKADRMVQFLSISAILFILNGGDNLMNELEVIRLLQRYRHDVANHLQIVHGYLSMGLKERAEEKLREWISLCEQERRLTSLRAPKFALWIFQFNASYNRLHLTYHIHTEQKDLSAFDEEIACLFDKLAQIALEEGEDNELYEAELAVEEQPDGVGFAFSIKGAISDPDEAVRKLHSLGHAEMATAGQDGFAYRFKIPYQP